MSSADRDDENPAGAFPPKAARIAGPGAPDVLVSLQTRGFIGRPGRTILFATVAGMFAMSVTFAFSPPFFVPMAGLIGGIMLVYGFRTGDMRYTLTNEGLNRSFRPLAARVFGLKGREQSFRFDEIRYYRRDRDWARYRAEEVESLKLAVSRPPYRIVITDMLGKDAFADFADIFEALAAGQRRETGAGAKGQAVGGKVPVIERRPGFYQTIWAKLLTAVFAIMAIALIVAFLAGMLSPTGVFRLLIVIIPGVIYMGWRVLRGRRDLPAADEGEAGP